jgi:DNA-binding PadR family transcriptional regulator
MKQGCELPGFTHLQFVVVSLLMDGERSGRQIRSSLADEGVDRSGPAFYQMMARMEEGGLVQGRYEPAWIGGQEVIERLYQVTDEGRKRWDSTLRFYRRFCSP